ncbi:MAG: hypothetical protein U5S82_00315 [Gammaproteobacteria bacterium]|nr:hypothetical protein [Gammaproteobacteria bacterium]
MTIQDTKYGEHGGDVKLASAAAQLLGACGQRAQELNSPAAWRNAAKMHDEGRLYRRLTVSMPYGGQDVHLRLTLHDPETDAVAVVLYDVTGGDEPTPPGAE